MLSKLVRFTCLYIEYNSYVLGPLKRQKEVPMPALSCIGTAVRLGLRSPVLPKIVCYFSIRPPTPS